MSEICKTCGGTGKVAVMESKKFVGFPGCVITCPTCKALPSVIEAGARLYNAYTCRCFTLIRVADIKRDENVWYALDTYAGVIELGQPHITTKVCECTLTNKQLQVLLNKLDPNVRWIVR